MTIMTLLKYIQQKFRNNY